MPIEKIKLLQIKIDDMTPEQLQTFVLGQKINEIIDFLSVPQCFHDYSQGTSGYQCKKCGQIKSC